MVQCLRHFYSSSSYQIPLPQMLTARINLSTARLQSPSNLHDRSFYPVTQPAELPDCTALFTYLAVSLWLATFKLPHVPTDSHQPS